MIDNTEIKTADAWGDEASLYKTEINRNYYIVVVRRPTDKSPRSSRFRRLVTVYSAPEDRGFPDHPYDVGQKYELVVQNEEKYNLPEVETQVSQALNDAVCEVEQKQADTQEFNDKVVAALAANKEVHGGIDYQLEQEQSTRD